MADFDPYHKWLGIPPKDQPPNHYRLLGIELFESDPDVIDAAADQRMSFIQHCSIGPHVAESQKLLNEIAAARVCLLQPKSKNLYDAGLRYLSDVPAAPAPSMSVEQAPARTAPAPTFQSIESQRTTRLQIVAASTVAVVLLLLSVSYFANRKDAREPPIVDTRATQLTSQSLPVLSTVEANSPEASNGAPVEHVTLSPPQSPSQTLGDRAELMQRGEPEYLPVPQLETTTFSGPFALKNPYLQLASRAGRAIHAEAHSSELNDISNNHGVQAPQDSVVEGVRWACVTGVVPYREQIKKYEREFGTAQLRNAQRDFPYWAGFLVERSEVTLEGLNDPSKSQWVKLSVKKARDFAATWAVRAREVVDPAYTDESLTFPLGPLLNRNWYKEVAHSRIPVLDITLRGALSGAQDLTPESTAPADVVPIITEGTDLDILRRQSTARRSVAAAGEVSGTTTAIPDAAVSDAIPDANMPQELEFQLFRFFDFTVEEGKRYRYRVQLVLDNPNYNVQQQYLKDPKLADDQLRFSPMSEPSPVASVHSISFVLAGKVKPPDNPVDEAEVRLIVFQLDPTMYMEVAYEVRPAKPKERREVLPMNRGRLIQFSANVDMVHPLTNMPIEATVEFTPNLVVVDLRGGESFAPGSFRDREITPGEVLFMAANGRLISRSEVEDEDDYQAEVTRLQELQTLKESASERGSTDSGSIPPRPGRPRGKGV